MRLTYKQPEQKMERHHGIKCWTCNRLLASKASCKSHQGHDVTYLNLDGTRAD